MRYSNLRGVPSGYDVVVIGAGAAGMSAALFSAIRGARTLLVEKSGFVGGTSALSAGSIWIPNTRHASEVAVSDSADNAERYLQQIIGNRVRTRVVKNKVAPPFKIAELEILATEGISREGGLIDMGLATSVLSKYGAWLNYGEQRLGQGRENAKQFLRDHADVAAEVETKVRAASGNAAVAASVEE